MSVKVQKIQRVNSAYIGDGIAQVMVPFSDSYMSIINGQGLLYHYSSDSNYCNEYLEDTRRFQFPYYSIPVHKEKRDGVIFTYVNQIFDINKPYIILKDGKIIQNVLLESARGFNCLLDVHRVLKPVEAERVSVKGVSDLSEHVNRAMNLSEGDKYVFSDGGIVSNEISYEDKHEIGKNETKVIVTINGGDIASVMGLKIFKNDDNFKFMVFDFPLVEYSSNKLSSIADYVPLTPEPKIKRRFNPAVTRESIIGSKTMARFKTRN